jgi:lipopolysaccharide biosynthesis glycosyltransferase
MRGCFLLTLTGRDDSFLRHGALVTLTSLRVTNPHIPIVILFDELDREQRELLRDYDLRWFDVNLFKRSNASVTSRPDLDNCVFLRFGVETILDFDTALYLDCDLVALDRLDPIFHMCGAMVGRPMNDHPLADQFLDGKYILANEQLPAEQFAVNAGVIKFDIWYWRKLGLRDQVLQLSKKYGWESFLYSDQSILNLLGYRIGTFHHMSKVWNFSWWPDMRRELHILERNNFGLMAPVTDEGPAKIVHWTGPIKPWHPTFRALSLYEQELYCGPCYRQFAMLRRRWFL